MEFDLNRDAVCFTMTLKIMDQEAKSLGLLVYLLGTVCLVDRDQDAN